MMNLMPSAITQRQDVVLSQSAVQALRGHIAQAHGREVCGFLFGSGSECRIEVESAQPVTNIYEAQDSFAISQEEYASALRSARDDTRLVGIYHTHSGPARASHQDRRGILASPYFWLIVGHAGEPQQEWRCFAQSKGKLRELSLIART